MFTKRLLSKALAVACLVHILFLFVANAPLNPLKQAFFSKFEESYTNGMFKQNWSFFSPVPTHSNELLFQCSTDGKNWSPEVSPLQRRLDSAHQNPLSSDERISLLLKDIADEVVDAVHAKKAANGSSIELSTLPNKRNIEIIGSAECKGYKSARVKIISQNVVVFSKRESLRSGKISPIPDFTVSLNSFEVK